MATSDHVYAVFVLWNTGQVMGFWLLVPGVGMGGGTTDQPTGRWEYAATYAPWEYAAPLSIEYAADGLIEHAVEAP